MKYICEENDEGKCKKQKKEKWTQQLKIGNYESFFKLKNWFVY